MNEREDRRGRRGEHHERNGFGRPGRRGPGRGRRRGDIRRLLLAGLIDGPAHGYELMRRLEERSGGGWRPSPGSVYPMLQQLEDEGLVQARDEEGRKVYDLTESGREQADPATLDALAGEPTDGPGQGLHDELRQLALAARQIHAVGDDAQVAEAAGVLRQARQTIYRLLSES